MRKLYLKKITLVVLSVLMLLSACSKVDELFSGTDNFITAFSLLKDGTTYNATLYGDSIIITVPSTVKLEGATPTVTLSENASISPDPEKLTGWDDEIIFTIISHNGKRKQYRYQVNRNDITTEGSVLLTTQAEVEAFGKLGYSSVSGNLVIGRSAGADTITSLGALYQLRKIGYSLIVNSTYNASEFVGLDNLEVVGGTIQLESLVNLKSVDLPALKSVGGLSVSNSLLKSVLMPKLTSVNNDIKITGPLATTAFPSLSSVGGTITFTTTKAADAQLSKISFPVLKSTGGLSFSYFINVEKAEFPELETTGNLYFYYLSKMRIIYCPKLKESTGTITIPYFSSLTEASFPLLEKAAALNIENRVISSLDFPLLTSVTGKLSLSYLPIKDLSGFPSLKDAGEIYIYDASQIDIFEPPVALKSAGKISFYYYSTYGPTEINVKGIELGELYLKGGTFRNNLKITGDDIFNGTLTIEAGSIPSGRIVKFPQLDGFSEIDSLSFTSLSSAMPAVEISGVKKIYKSLQLPNASSASLIMPDLEYIGGYLKINSLTSLTDETFSFPKLRTIGGYLYALVYSTSVKTLSFPLLESVGGDLTLYTGYATRSLTSALFPSLTLINGKLTITSYTSGSNLNTMFTNLDGFSSLSTVNGITIKNQSVLTSYEGIKNAISSFTSSDWNVSDNSYNPTYEDLVAGQWIKP